MSVNRDKCSSQFLKIQMDVFTCLFFHSKPQWYSFWHDINRGKHEKSMFERQEMYTFLHSQPFLVVAMHTIILSANMYDLHALGWFVQYLWISSTATWKSSLETQQSVLLLQLLVQGWELSAPPAEAVVPLAWVTLCNIYFCWPIDPDHMLESSWSQCGVERICI